MLLIRSQPAHGKGITVGEREMACSGCKKAKYASHGWYRGKHEDRQIYKCSICGRRFRDNLGFEYRHVPRPYITLALMVWGMGMSVGNIRMTLKHLRVDAHQDTIIRILEHYSGMVERHAETLKPPCAGDKWGCDEKRQDIHGREWWIVAVMDISTGSSWRGTFRPPRKDTTPFPAAEGPGRGGQDSPGVHHGRHLPISHRLQSVPYRKGLRPIHIRDIHIRTLICNTNKQERLNGELAGRFRYARGINKEESLIFRMAILHHRSIRPHGGTGGRTLAETAGMDIRSTDKWLTPRQNAAAAA